jgi:outer membrane protein assembly factor BamA
MVLLYSCSPARRVPEGSSLLNRNHIEIRDAQVKPSDLDDYFRQEPNRRILGVFRFHLHVYNFADGFKENRVTLWMKNTIGEPPVIYNRTLTENTQRQFELYMHSKGYFNANVDYFENKRNQKTNITYAITGNEPYTIRNINFAIEDPYILSFIDSDKENSLIRENEKYDADLLEDERNRIARNLRDDGFFQFSREFIFFEVDSNLNNHQVDILLRINNLVKDQSEINPNDSLANPILRHKRFLIDQVTILPNFSAVTANEQRSDTTIFTQRGRRNRPDYDYIFLHSKPLRIRPSVIANHLMIKQGEFFKLSNVEQTYSFLSEMRNYRFINLQFQPTENPISGTFNDTIGFLNASVQLNRSAANAFTVEAEGLNTAGNLGIASNILYQNRNVFGGAEIFNLRLKGALEVSGETVSSEVIERLPFNTLELGAEIGVDFPKLLFPVNIQRLSRNSRPKSSIVAGINFRQRPDYTRYILNLNYGFEWSETSRKRHFINPVEISSVRVFNDSILRANIPDANPLILSRFRDHFILGLKYTYVYNSQVLGRTQDFSYLRANFESAGNLLNAVAKNLDLSIDDNGSYNVFEIPFSQFVKADVDYRYYRVLDIDQTLVFRVMGGAGVPYGNVRVLPFIKSFYGGGANGLRAWKIYTLGPGSYSGTDEVRFDRYGDIKLEANLEYRFKFYSFWHGAFFLDAGNVWFVRQNDQFPGGEFKFSKLTNDLAIGGGVGVRMDFSFFILRVDGAVPFKDPSKPIGNQWISGWPPLDRFNLNLGIGYPF